MIATLSDVVAVQDEITLEITRSLGLAVEDVTAAELAYRRAVERGVGTELTL